MANDVVSELTDPAGSPPAQPGARRPLWHRIVTAPTTLALAIALVGFAWLAAWAVSSPQGSSPDDDFHLPSIWCVGVNATVGQCSPAPHTAPLDAGTQSLLVTKDIRSFCYQFHTSWPAQCVPGLGSELVSGRANAGLYPSGFYRVMHLFAGRDVAVSIQRMRVVNAFIAVTFIGFALCVAGPGLRRAGALMWAIGVVPLGLFFIPSTNPTSWAVIGLGTFWIFTIAMLRAPNRVRRVAAGVGMVAAYALAAAARRDAPPLACAIGVTCLIAAGPWRRDRRWLGALPVVLLMGVAFVQYELSNASGIAANGLGSTGLENAKLQQFGVLHQFLTDLYGLPDLLLGSFGVGRGLGWLDTPIPPVVGIAVVVAIVLVIAPFLAAAGRRQWLAVACIGGATVLVPLVIMQASGPRAIAVQPRYVLPLVLVTIGTSIYAGLASENGRRPVLSRSTQWLVVLLVGTANSYALRTNIQRYHVGLETNPFAVRTHRTWWWDNLPFSAPELWALGTLAGFAAVAGLVVLASRASSATAQGSESASASVHTR